MTVNELLQALAVGAAQPDSLLVANVGGIGREVERVEVVRDGSQPRVIVMVADDRWAGHLG